MAVVILGGLVTSTLLNLFLLPSAHHKFGLSRRHQEQRTAYRNRRTSAGARLTAPFG